MSTGKYPHTRAYLTALAREHNPPLVDTDDSSSGDNDDQEPQQVKWDIVKDVVRLLEEEDEELLKQFLKETYTLESDTDQLDHYVLELMHKHKDDIQGVPFVLLASSKRPISRPSSRASTHSFRAVSRPDTPLAVSLRRPHTPMASPLSAGLHSYGLPPPSLGLGTAISAAIGSPAASPTIAHASAVSASFHHPPASQPSSPLVSPHFLNAKAPEFRPGSRPHSAMSGGFPMATGGARPDSPSSDLWAHPASHPLSLGSPRRTSSSLAIASPLVSDVGYYPRPGMSLGRSNSARSNSGLRRSSAALVDSSSSDMLSSAGKELKSFSAHINSATTPFDQLDTPLDPTTDQQDMFRFPVDDQAVSNDDPYRSFYDPLGGGDDHFIGGDVGLDGMTPFDVLSSIFGSTLPPARLEEALSQNGYNFDNAMAWLVDGAHPSAPSQLPSDVRSPAVQILSGGGRVVSITSAGKGHDTTNSNPGRTAGSWISTRPAVATGGRVCRYFLAGECRRADCRFNHDIERALCRFWLRGQCAKGEQCEFLHALPQEVNIPGITAALSATDTSNPRPQTTEPALDDFPILSATVPSKNDTPGSVLTARTYDPSRTRFAAAVKKVPGANLNSGPSTGRGKPSVPAPVQRSGLATPRPSPRIKLRPPSLLPTLVTGESVNRLYMQYRSHAIHLGTSRNAFLTKAAEAWKRGDGAGAKRFSREANEINLKMSLEATEAAAGLVKERAKAATAAVRQRDPSWSDDPQDRATKGKAAGAGLGVLMGVASANLGGLNQTGRLLSPEERTECLLDLHGLHSSEAVDVLEEFFVELEKEHFLGLAYVVVGEEKHTGTQDAARGASRARVASWVKEWLHRWGYPWNEREGVICVDPLTHS